MQHFNYNVRARARTTFAFGLACALSFVSFYHGARAEEGEIQDWHTRGNQIIHGHDAVRLSGVNWYGFETTTFVAHGLWAQDYKSILNSVKANGYNVIRVPFSNEMVETNPVPTALSFSNASGPINTDLQGRTSLQILDKIINYAGSIGLSIILDNHRSEAGNSAEANGLWYTTQFPETAWLKDWATLAARYAHTPAVIGMDLRNEPHFAYNNGACWTGDTFPSTAGCPKTDAVHNWPAAAERAGNLILAINPRLLIFVEGTDEYNFIFTWFGGSLNGVAQFPVALRTPHKVVYSAHDYGPDLFHQNWFNSTTSTASLFTSIWDTNWGFISNQKIAPVWVGEFGTPNTSDNCDPNACLGGDPNVNIAPGSQGQWFASMVQYLGVHPQISWTYWALNGNDKYGLLDSNFDATPANALKQELLSGIQFQSQDHDSDDHPGEDH
jgi:endoglucanase